MSFLQLSRCYVGFLNKADKKAAFLSDDPAPIESKTAFIEEVHE